MRTNKFSLAVLSRMVRTTTTTTAAAAVAVGDVPFALQN